MPEAVEHFEAALRTMRDLGEGRYEGQTLGYLGRALVRMDLLEAARDCFEQGRRLLAADPLSLGILYCDLARCEWSAFHPATRKWASFWTEENPSGAPMVQSHPPLLKLMMMHAGGQAQEQVFWVVPMTAVTQTMQ